MKAVDHAVQNIKEDMENNADEDVNVKFDINSEIDYLYVASDLDEDHSCDFAEEQPHSDAKRKLVKWAANQNVSHSALSELLHVHFELGLN